MLVCCYVPNDFQNTVGDNEHFASYLPFPANQIAGGEYERPHFQNQVVQKFRLTLLENGNLRKKEVMA